MAVRSPCSLAGPLIMISALTVIDPKLPGLLSGMIAFGPCSAIRPICGFLKIPPVVCDAIGTTGEIPGAGAIIGGCRSEIFELKLFKEAAAEFAALENVV